ncbi:putative transporter (transmembrane protein) [Collimonas sp. PA-H2]|uniref:mechanosensitive ion channel n=1 Tax=Collimonas sp. PA-H2 TaxID=1881062 RepID=UPI000BF97087|nr:mechanosensitive ion channel [Collimonas sp. PA-H2]PFH08047.1 putative transporter (transmembrane protein) [Collimonas sp. PA-H2]
MDLSSFFISLQNTLGAYLPKIAGALGILIIGWLIAVVARAAARKLLNALKVDQRITESTGQGARIEGMIASGLFWLILLITAVGIFNVLNLYAVSNPFAQLVTRIINYLPNLIGGAVLALVAWLIASLLRSIADKALRSSKLDDKLAEATGMQPMSGYLGNVLFWLVILMFIPAILAVFNLNGLLTPVQGMTDKLLAFVPNIFAAAVIALVGWILAKILRGLVVNLLVAAGADKLAQGAESAMPVKLSSLAGAVVYIFVFVPTLISALDALKIEAISRPATNLLDQFLGAVPNIVGAVVILLVTFYAARFVGALLQKLLVAAGADGLPSLLGLEKVFTSSLQPSTVAGRLVVFFAMLFAVVEAANRLGFSQVRDVVTLFIEFGAHILMGSVILIIGFWLAGLARRVIQQADNDNSNLLARIAQFAILGLVFAMGLRAMGIANEIVQIAFGLVLGAIAVAIALAFGLGGREAAGKLLERWFNGRSGQD